MFLSGTTQMSPASPLTDIPVPFQMHHRSQRLISRLSSRKLESHTAKEKKAQRRQARVMAMI